MSTINYNIRLDQDLRDRAFAVFESYGLSPSQAIKLFLNQVADTRAIPLSFTHHADKSPNTVTARAMREAIENRRNGTLGEGYTDLDALARDIRDWVE